MANVWFYVAERVHCECYVIHFKDDNKKKFIRMGITVRKAGIWGSKSPFSFMVANCVLRLCTLSSLWSQIALYGSAVAPL